MSILSMKRASLYPEKNTNEGLNLLQEILNDLLRRQLNNKILSTNNMQGSSEEHLAVSSAKKRKMSYKYLNVNSIHQLSDDEVSRHIKNLQSSLSRVKEENKPALRVKLQALLDLRAERRNK